MEGLHKGTHPILLPKHCLAALQEGKLKTNQPLAVLQTPKVKAILPLVVLQSHPLKEICPLAILQGCRLKTNGVWVKPTTYKLQTIFNPNYTSIYKIAEKSS